MVMKGNHILEEKIVDYVLGNLSHKEYFKVNTHIKRCPKCYLHMKHWEKSLKNEIKGDLNTPAKHQIYDSFFENQRIKRRRLTFIFTSLSIVALIFMMVFLNGQLKSPTEVNFANNDNQQFTEQIYPNTHQLGDQTKLLLRTGVHPMAHETTDLNIKNNPFFLPELLNVKQDNRVDVLMNAQNQLCVINWETLEVACYEYIKDQNTQKSLLQIEKVKIPIH